MLEVGEQLGPYTIIRQLGAGGMGAVFLARHRHIGREAAIKVLLPELTRNEDIVARFLTEARATAAIRHAGIVEILDCDIDPKGRAFIVMEYLRGESVAQRLTRDVTSLRDLSSVIAVGIQVSNALAAAHERGIVHRDLKPDNIFLAGEGMGNDRITIKILDFGIAKLVSGNNEGTQHKTRTGSLLGTPAYMSPEQCRDASAIDHRADVYALGCIFFEMVAGRPPFVRQGSGEIIVAHVVEPPPRLSSLAPDVLPALESLVSQMLEKDPAARPQSMMEIAERLAVLGGGRPIPATAILSYGVEPGSGPVGGRSPSNPGTGRAPSYPGANPSPSYGGANPSMSKVPTPAPSMSKVPTPAPRMSTPVPSPTSSERSGPRGSSHLLAGGTRVMPAGNYTTMSDSAAEVADQVELPTRPPRRTALIAAVGGVAALAIVAVIVFAGGGSSSSKARHPVAAGQPPVGETTAPPPPAAMPPPPAPSTDVTLEVRSDPTDAEVWLATDKAARGKTPFRMTVERKGGPTHVILKARGYADKPVDLAPEGPSPVVVTMEKTAAEKTTPEKTTSRGHDTAADTADKDSDSKAREAQRRGGGKRTKDSYKMMGD